MFFQQIYLFIYAPPKLCEEIEIIFLIFLKRKESHSVANSNFRQTLRGEAQLEHSTFASQVKALPINPCTIEKRQIMGT